MAKRRVHRVPHAEVRAILVRNGINSVNRAIEWGDSKALILRPDGDRLYPLISAKSVEGILRGKRVLGVEFDRVDQLLCAMECPEAWYLDLAAWYFPPGEPSHVCEEGFPLSVKAAFERAQEMFEGRDAGLSFG